MQISKNKYNEWILMANVINNQYQNGYKKDFDAECVHDILIKFTAANIDLETVTNNYVFISLRNHIIDFYRDKKELHTLSYDINYNDDSYDDNSKIEINNKMEVIDNIEDVIENEEYIKKNNEVAKIVYEKLHEFDKKIWDHHFNKGWSQRKIGRETGINYQMINARVKSIKQKIEKEYEKMHNL